jgi:hypothetical protein
MSSSPALGRAVAVLSSSSLSLDEPSMSASVSRGLTAVVLHQGWSVSKPPPAARCVRKEALIARVEGSGVSAEGRRVVVQVIC